MIGESCSPQNPKASRMKSCCNQMVHRDVQPSPIQIESKSCMKSVIRSVWRGDRRQKKETQRETEK